MRKGRFSEAWSSTSSLGMVSIPFRPPHAKVLEQLAENMLLSDERRRHATFHGHG
jgi:hypothetical protein